MARSLSSPGIKALAKTRAPSPNFAIICFMSLSLNISISKVPESFKLLCVLMLSTNIVPNGYSPRAESSLQPLKRKDVLG